MGDFLLVVILGLFPISLELYLCLNTTNIIVYLIDKLLFLLS